MWVNIQSFSTAKTTILNLMQSWVDWKDTTKIISERIMLFQKYIFKIIEEDYINPVWAFQVEKRNKKRK